MMALRSKRGKGGLEGVHERIKRTYLILSTIKIKTKHTKKAATKDQESLVHK